MSSLSIFLVLVSGIMLTWYIINTSYTLVVMYCLLLCLTWPCSKILLSLSLENSSPWSWEGEECLSPHRKGQRNTATQRPAKSQAQHYCIAWTAGRENEGSWKKRTAVEILVWRDRCVEETVVCYNCKACWTWRQSQYTSFITGTNFFKTWVFFFFLVFSVTLCLMKNGFVKTCLSKKKKNKLVKWWNNIVY